MNAITLQAPAKINLILRVGPRDETGFHPLASWMCTVGLFDTLSIARADREGIAFECDDASLPRDSGNLVVKASQKLLESMVGYRQHEGLENPESVSYSTGSSRNTGLAISLRKQIPSAAGLGGGSSDAAATLVGINRLLNYRLPRPRLAEVARTLGSDIAFFLSQPSAWCTGRGDPARSLGVPLVARWVLLVFPSFGLSTAEVYRQFDAMSLGRTEDLLDRADAQELPTLPSSELLPRLINDLEPPAFALRPELGLLREAIEKHLHRPVRMSGSGSTLFTLFDERTEAVAASQSATDGFGVRTVVAEMAPKLDGDAYNLVDRL